MRLRIKFYIAILLLLPCITFAAELKINIKGTSPELTNIIRNDLHLHQATSESKLTTSRIKNLFHLAEEQITATLEAKGYYSSSIHSSLNLQPDTIPEQEKWLAVFIINPGKVTKISDINIEITGPGATNPKLKQLLKTPKLIPGNTITHENYEDTKDDLLADLNALGYLQASFEENIIEINRNDYIANIKFKIYTGEQYVFGKVTFNKTSYPYDFLIKFAPFHPGDAYELEKLIEFQSNLEGSDLFSKIRFDTINNLSDPNNTVVPIHVRLDQKLNNRYSGSVGYGTDTGFRGSLAWLHRRADTEGHKVFTSILASQVRSIAQLNYIIPGSHPATDKYILGVLGQVEKFEELYSRKAEISGNKIMKRGKLESMYGIWYFTETFRIVHGDPTINKKYLLPTAKWVWTDAKTTDEFEFGTRCDIRIRGGIQGVMSDNSVGEIEANAKKIFPMTQQMRLLLRTNLGAVASHSFDLLPPSLRFFAGGDESVRGYAYNSLGPLADPGDPDSTTGGRYLFIASGEIEHKLYEKISGVVFFDAGNTALSMKMPLALGTGVGIRYKTPVGKFRLDLAKPLNTVVNKHWRVHVNFGTDL